MLFTPVSNSEDIQQVSAWDKSKNGALNTGVAREGSDNKGEDTGDTPFSLEGFSTILQLSDWTADTTVEK